MTVASSVMIDFCSLPRPYDSLMDPSFFRQPERGFGIITNQKNICFLWFHFHNPKIEKDAPKSGLAGSATLINNLLSALQLLLNPSNIQCAFHVSMIVANHKIVERRRPLRLSNDLDGLQLETHFDCVLSFLFTSRLHHS
jgi:hypothetical protein